jgi:hypothetical protein
MFLHLACIHRDIGLLGIAVLTCAIHTAAQTGIPIPTGTWTMVLTRGVPVSSNDWEQLVYVSPLKRSVMLSQYHQTDSEPNESLVGYNFDANNWDILNMGGLFHTESMPEGGESVGYLDFDPSTNSLVYHCCTSGSNQSESINHTWWFDVLGQSGRDKQPPTEPSSMALQPGGAFDIAANVFVAFGGSSYEGTWIYDPAANTWQQEHPTGTPPDPSLILPGMAYDSNAQQVYLFGGLDGTTYSSNLYAYNASSNTWTLISPLGGVEPPGRYRTNFAYDSTHNIFLLYGGQNASGVLGDTWVYNPTANTWTQLTPAQSPPINTVADFARLSYDSDHNVFVLAHKGTGGYFGGTWTTLPIQTWLFRYAGTGPSAGTQVSTAQPAPGSIDRNISGWGKDPALASSGGSLFVAWSETGSPFDTSAAAWLHIYADQYTGANWLPLGNSFESLSGGPVEAHSPSLAIVGGVPWASWYQATSGSTTTTNVYAADWNGSLWQGGPIGLVGSGANQGRSQIVDVGGVPFIAFIEVSKSTSPNSSYAYVKSWNGASWVLTSATPLNRSTSVGATVSSLSIASDGTYPYVAWTEYVRTLAPNGGQVDSAPQVYVSQWNGTQWASVGGALNISSSHWASDPSISYFGSALYVAWTERTETGNAGLYVATWNGASWVLTSATPLNQGGMNGWAYHPSLVADPVGSKLYVAWVEQTALGAKARVYVDQLVNGVWTALGGTLNVDPVGGSAERVGLGIYNNEPVAAWSEVESGAIRQIYVSQWNGATWTQLPGSGGGVDVTPPTRPVNLSASVVSQNQINLAWSGSTDAVGVEGYYVYRNGSQIANITTSFTYQETSLSPLTSYSYYVIAYDVAGNMSAPSATVTATTTGVATTPPTVTVTSPTGGATVAGTITVSARATDTIAMKSVQFQIDGVNLGTLQIGSGPSYSVSWKTTAVNNGSHTISAIATDTSGLSATSSISVTVYNPPPPPPTEPVISAVGASTVSSSSATINWTTDEASTSQVN